MFFMNKKKNDLLRLVIDARRASRIFADAPGVARGLARLQVADGVTPHMAEVDVDNCFFCLPPIRASEAGDVCGARESR